MFSDYRDFGMSIDDIWPAPHNPMYVLGPTMAHHLRHELVRHARATSSVWTSASPELRIRLETRVSGACYCSPALTAACDSAVRLAANRLCVFGPASTVPPPLEAGIQLIGVPTGGGTLSRGRVHRGRGLMHNDDGLGRRCDVVLASVERELVATNGAVLGDRASDLANADSEQGRRCPLLPHIRR